MGNRAIIVALLAFAATLYAPSEAQAQCSGQPPGNTVCAAPNGAPGLPRFRTLVPADLPGATVSSVFARTGAVVATAGDYSFSLISGAATFSQLPTISANNLYGNIGAGAVGLPVPACAGASNALIWTAGTGFSCNTISAAASSVNIGTTTVAGGTATRVLFNNGTLGEYAISGTGSVAMTNTPTFTAPVLGAATATSINGVGIVGGPGAAAFGSGGTVTYTIASGTAALGTSVIASPGCASAVTVAAAGVATTDTLTASFSSDPTGVTGYTPVTTGMLAIIPYPTAGNVNFKVCNTTAASITPGAITLNWRVVR